MKILLVAGARPNFMKVASIIDAITGYNHSTDRPIHHFLLHTGQHYDEQMSQAFFADLALPRPDVDLEVGSSSDACQMAEIMKRCEPVFLKEQPDVIVVVGDVNSTAACALVASKMIYPRVSDPSQRSRPLLAHVEAGLRSFDRSMPEEINRIVTDALSDFLFTTEKDAKKNLLREGIPQEKIYFVGNTMVDTLVKHRRKAQESTVLSRLGLRDPEGHRVNDYGVVTLHRPSNVDNEETFREILESLAAIGKEIPLFFPAHPRTLHRINEFRCEGYFDFVTDASPSLTRSPLIRCLRPLGYLDFLCLMSNAKLVLTDSGGIQEETTVLGIPCVTLRHNTERPITITQGTNVLAGTSREAIIHHAFTHLNHPPKAKRPQFWDGRAGARIIQVLTQYIT